MNIDQLLNEKPGEDKYRFHGVREATLARLVAQSENGQIVLWGRDTEDEGEYLEGAGELSVTDISDVEMSYNEFCDEGGLVLVLEKLVAEPVEVRHETDRRERLVDASEWQVVGGLRPVFDEDGDVIDQEVFSLEEIVEM